MQSHQPLINLGPRCSHSISKKLVSLPIRAIERLLAVDAVNRWYADLIACDSLDAPFTKILNVRGISYLLSADDLAKIPRQGPLVVVANHPFGGLEGVILGDLLQRVRPDTKILGNYLLEKIEPIKDSVIPVDPAHDGFKSMVVLRVVRIVRTKGKLSSS